MTFTVVEILLLIFGWSGFAGFVGYQLGRDARR